MKRQRTGAKKLDLSVIRGAMMDGRVWTGMGVVRKFDGETSHFEVDTTAGEADVLIDVELAPNGERLVCRLGVPGGVWKIPAVGTEVAIIVPEGDFDADAIIVAELSTGTTASGLDGATIVIRAPVGGRVLIHDGNASDAQALATIDDIDALRDTVDDAVTLFNAHTHLVPGAVAGGPGITSAAVISAMAMSGPGFPNGTQTLRAK